MFIRLATGCVTRTAAPAKRMVTRKAEDAKPNPPIGMLVFVVVVAELEELQLHVALFSNACLVLTTGSIKSSVIRPSSSSSKICQKRQITLLKLGCILVWTKFVDCCLW